MSEPSSASSRRCFPDWVLVDPIAHVAPLKNATTAGTMTSALFPIDVSFEVVDPPGLSRCVLNCPELKADVIGAHRVIAADGAFLLIIVGFPDRIVRRMRNDVFVYSAGLGTPPLLRLLPSFPDNIYSKHAGVLSCGDGHCLVVCPNRRLDDDDHHQMIISYDLEVFSTETNSWTTRSARVPSDLQGRCSPLLRHQPNKVFSVGGNSLAWVDMSLGVLLCDLLCNDPMVRLIDLPPLLPANKVYLGGGSLGPKRILRATRDVICKDGWIRCIEIEFPELMDINPKFHWNAIMSKRRMFSSDEWETFTMESASLSTCFPDPLFPEICDGNGKLTLDKVMSTAPILDAHHENVVYMRSGVNPCDPNGWVFAIDIKDKKLLTAVRALHCQKVLLQSLLPAM